MGKGIRGSCLCGQVSWTVTGPFDAFHLCHCSRCRKATGSAHAANIFTRPENITWLSGQALIKRFDLPEAERFAKCFCTHCGSTVPYLGRTGQYLVIPAGALDEDPGIAPLDNIFWADRAGWYDDGLKSEKFDAYPK